MKPMIDDPPLQTPEEAAYRLGVSVKTLRRYADTGVIEVRKTPGGHRRYHPKDVERLVQGMKGEAPSGS